MRVAVFILIPLLSLAACGKKAAPEAAAATAAPEPAPASISVKMPGGADSKSFAKALIDLEVINWKPEGAGSSVRFIYKTADFKADGTWRAEASVEANFEEIPCVESGSWSIAAVESSQVGTIEWTVTKTNCAMREAPIEKRGQVTMGKGSTFAVAFR